MQTEIHLSWKNVGLNHIIETFSKKLFKHFRPSLSWTSWCWALWWWSCYFTLNGWVVVAVMLGVSTRGEVPAATTACPGSLVVTPYSSRVTIGDKIYYSMTENKKEQMEDQGKLLCLCCLYLATCNTKNSKCQLVFDSQHPLNTPQRADLAISIWLSHLLYILLADRWDVTFCSKIFQSHFLSHRPLMMRLSLLSILCIVIGLTEARRPSNCGLSCFRWKKCMGVVNGGNNR